MADLFLYNCRNILILDLFQCPDLNDILLESILKENLRIQYLNIACHLQISDVTLENISTYCESLKFLCIKGCDKLTYKGLKRVIRNCKLIEALDVSSCSAIENTSMLSILFECRVLKYLDFSECRKYKNELSYFEGISSSVLHLRLRNFHQLESFLPNVASYCENIESLDLGSCKLSSRYIRSLTKCKKLRSLRIHEIYGVDVDSEFRHLFKSCRFLEFIDFSFCEAMTCRSLKAISEFCHSLKTLIVQKCEKLGDEGILAIANSFFRTLKKLDLCGCTRVSESALGFLVGKCSGLTHLNLGQCKVGDSLLRSIAKLGYLEVLELNRCFDVTDNGLFFISEIEACVSLRRFSIEWNDKITTRGISYLQNCKQKQLEIVVRHCSKCSMSRQHDLFGSNKSTGSGGGR
jgi:hypothetical protein